MWDRLNRIEQILLLIVIIVAVIVAIFLLKQTAGVELEGTCRSDDQCPGTSVCSHGECYECAFNGDCAGSEFCISGVCQPAPAGYCSGACSLDQTAGFDTFLGSLYPNPFGFWDGGVQLLGENKGKIIGAGYMRMVRLNQDGSIDTTFGSNGVVNLQTGIPFSFYLDAIWVDLNDNIYVVFYSLSGNIRAVAAKWLPDGALDTSWGTSGYYAPDYSTFGFSQERFRDIKALPDGSVLILHRAGYVIKLDPLGVPVAGFGSGGILNMRTVYNLNETWVIDTYEDRLFVQFIWTNNTIAAYDLETGAQDLSYGDNGAVSIHPDNFGYSCAEGEGYGGGIGPDGSFWSTMWLSVDGCDRWPTGVIKVKKNGTIDTSFGNGGIYVDEIDQPGWDLNWFSETYHRPVFNTCNGNFMMHIQFYAGDNNWDGFTTLVLTPTGDKVEKPNTQLRADGTFDYGWSSIPHPDGKMLVIGEYYNSVSDRGPKIWSFDCDSVDYALQTRPW